VNFVLDTIPPLIVVTSPSLTNKAAYTLAYTVDGGAKTVARSLVEGENKLTISETDLAGNTATKEVTVTLDTMPPLIQISDDAPLFANQTNFVLAYKVDGADKTKRFQLHEGPNALTVQETDAAGNTASADWHVLLDTSAPIGAISVNNGSAFTSGTSVDIALSVTETGSGADAMRYSLDLSGCKPTFSWRLRFRQEQQATILKYRMESPESGFRGEIHFQWPPQITHWRPSRPFYIKMGSGPIISLTI
jgi:Bacterial Ig-like domain